MSGPPSNYTDADATAAATAAGDAWDDDDQDAPEYVTVQSDAEYAGERARPGKTTTFRVREDLREPLRDALRDAATAGKRQRTSGKYTSRNPLTQTRQLNRTVRGRQALRDAGVSERTERRIRSGKGNPSAATQRKISEAYSTLQSYGAGSRSESARRAGERLLNVLTRNAERVSGVTVRFRNIRSLDTE